MNKTRKEILASENVLKASYHFIIINVTFFCSFWLMIASSIFNVSTTKSDVARFFIDVTLKQNLKIVEIKNSIRSIQLVNHVIYKK
jgi:hypothetical protein